jgi:hypothetical protein
MSDYEFEMTDLQVEAWLDMQYEFCEDCGMRDCECDFATLMNWTDEEHIDYYMEASLFGDC